MTLKEWIPIFIFEIVGFGLSIFGVCKWLKNVDSWTARNYPSSEEYMVNLLFGAASLMLLIIMIIGNGFVIGAFIFS
jgi:hypothetical protein